jgi:hypothetical protein
MRLQLALMVAIPWLAWCSAAVAQSAGSRAAIEQEVKSLDAKEAAAVLQGDYATIDKLWASDLVINNPFNQAVQASKGPVRTGGLTYSSFVREVELMRVHGDTVFVMGRETVVPKGTSPGSGTTIHRRYTNVWMKRDGQWRLTARHANVVCVG